MAQDFTEQRFDYSGERTDKTPELIVMVGFSGSGKSVLSREWVKRGQGNVVRLNRDSLRAMLYGDVPWNSHLENLVRNLETEAARMALQTGKDVIIDDTNCVRRTRQKWEEFAQNMHVRLRLISMTTPIEVCIERDAKREGKERVGEMVIRKQRKDLWEASNAAERPLPKALTRPYFERQALLAGGFLPRLEGCPWVLVDVDGTLANANGVRGPFEEHKVLLDNVYDVVADWVRALQPTHNICIVSGRHDWCGDDTVEWLQGHSIPFDHILMRYSEDNRKDTIVKKEILDELSAVVGRENIAFVLDDRPCVVKETWRANGIKVYPVRGTPDHTPDCPKDGPPTKTCEHCGALGDF
jgi:predicted kinase